MNPEDAASESAEWVGNRNVIVPPDIVPVRRTSPLPSRKRTPCRPRPDGEPVDRAGGRDWLSDRLFADTKTPDLGKSCSSSFALHVGSLIGLLVLLASQPASTTSQRVSESLRMPIFVAVMGGSAGSAAARAASQRPLATGAPAPRAMPPATRRVREQSPARQLQAVASVTPAETPEEAPEKDQSYGIDQAPTESPQGTPGGMPEGAAGGAEGAGTNGVGSGSGRTGAGDGSSGVGMAPGPYRLGAGIEPPRKIKDVRPIYPAGALAMHSLGTVAIEAIVGADGRVQRATVVQSIPALDQAALEAVRQWEFAPARLNGVAVAVIVTVLVRFTLF